MSLPARVRSKTGKPSTRKSSTASTTPPAQAVGDAQEVAEGAILSVYGDVHGGLSQIRASIVRLVLTFGEFSDGRDVLVPLVDWQTYGFAMPADVEPGSDDQGPLLDSRLLSFDNLAFLLQDISYDTRKVVRLLVAQSKSGVPPSEERTRYTARMLRLASKHLSSAAEQMAGLLDEAGEDLRQPRSESDGRPKRRTRPTPQR